MYCVFGGVFAFVTHVSGKSCKVLGFIMSKNTVFEGWLTKSPPSRSIWKAKWRRRWFALRQSGELPGQYFLDYYADRNCRRRKGTIDLDLCEQVDAGLHMERCGGGSPKYRGCVFTVRTSSRTYHLEADSEADMEKWVDAICRVCGLRPTDDSFNKEENDIPLGVIRERYISYADSASPYIPISECITGVRDPQRAFTFDPKNIVTSSAAGRMPVTRQPMMRVQSPEFSENDSNLSEDDCRSLNVRQSNIPIGDWSVAKSFTKLTIAPKQNGLNDGNVHQGPPRPPKATQIREMQRDSFQGPKIPEPTDVVEPHDNMPPWRRGTCRIGSNATMITTPIERDVDHSKSLHYNNIDEEEFILCKTPQYYNIGPVPPYVNRALKPRLSSHSVGHIHNLFYGHPMDVSHGVKTRKMKSDVLQYLDLDLHPSKPISIKPPEIHKSKMEVAHSRSPSRVDANSDYKTVDFLKTEAFNITRLDAEALRSMAM